MLLSLLIELGLTENEAKTYLALNRIGLSTTSRIVDAADISSGKVYETLERLHKKGLVATSQINGIKHFQTTAPEALTTYLEEQKKQLQAKEEQLRNALPQLTQLQASAPFKAETLIGTRSAGPLIKHLFANAKKTILAMGIRGDKRVKYNNFWWHLTTSHANKTRYLFVENDSEYYKKHLSLPHVTVRCIKAISPSAIDIIDDHVLLFSYDEDELHCVHMQNSSIAASFRSFFDTLWEHAK